MWRGGLMLALACAVGACGDSSPTSLPADATIELTVSGLRAAEVPAPGRYAAWAFDRTGTVVALGLLDGNASYSWPNPLPGLDGVQISYEPTGVAGSAPSGPLLLRGELHGDNASLSVSGAVTLGGQQLRTQPGQFTMFTPSDNAVHGYPSFEESGVWLFNMAPRETPQNDMWVRLTQLQSGWTYEGWMVRDIDSPAAVWLSYGKFLPDATGAVNKRDDTGWGPFSGVTNFSTAGEEEFPGDDWISNPLGFPVPSGLTLPLNLREKNASGAWRWTHVITIEPLSDRGEGVGRETPFAIRPYRDVFGDGAPGVPRTISFRADGVPSGHVVLR